MTDITLESIFHEYKRIKESLEKKELSDIHMQGALAYLELKAQDAGIVFVAPELKRSSSNYAIPEDRPTGELFKKGIIEDENSEDDYPFIDPLDYSEESSELFEDSDNTN